MKKAIANTLTMTRVYAQDFMQGVRGFKLRDNHTGRLHRRAVLRKHKSKRHRQLQKQLRFEQKVLSLMSWVLVLAGLALWGWGIWKTGWSR
jgi:hypothetical protein